MTTLDFIRVLAVAGALAAMSLYVVVAEVLPERRERRWTETGEHTGCTGCGTPLCAHDDDRACPGRQENACPHHDFLCGECRQLDCHDCRINALDDAGALG